MLPGQWRLPPDRLFHNAVYYRGAMTLHALRNEVGDADFFRILRTWAADRADAHGTTGRFIRHAEAISGEELDELLRSGYSRPAGPARTVTPQNELRRLHRTGLCRQPHRAS